MKNRRACVAKHRYSLFLNCINLAKILSLPQKSMNVPAGAGAFSKELKRGVSAVTKIRVFSYSTIVPAFTSTFAINDQLLE